MLPYTPLHHLLLADFGSRRAALVMTSGNVSDDPIAFEDDDALGRLAPIADLFLVGDREIATRTDDSVVRAVDAGAAARRPAAAAALARLRPVTAGRCAPEAGRPLLACGAQQKSTFCLAKGSRAWVSHHIGDLEHFATVQAFREGIAHFERLFAVEPELVVHDLHPDYLSTTYALSRDGVDHVGVQHHHAHLAACLAEHGVWDAPAVGAIFDGTGYGLDGTGWGGELLFGGLTGFERAGSAAAGADAGRGGRDPPAVADGVRVAGRGVRRAADAARPRCDGSIAPRRWDGDGADRRQPGGVAADDQHRQVVRRRRGAVWAARHGQLRGSSGGRARGGGLGGGRPCGAYEFGRGRLGPATRGPAMRAIVTRARCAASSRRRVAARFHAGVAAARRSPAVSGSPPSAGVESAVLSGGVFQNRLLLETVAAGLERAGLRVLVPELLPANDGGISYGQAAVGPRRSGA